VLSEVDRIIICTFNLGDVWITVALAAFKKASASKSPTAPPPELSRATAERPWAVLADAAWGAGTIAAKTLRRMVSAIRREPLRSDRSVSVASRNTVDETDRAIRNGEADMETRVSQ